MNTDKPILQLMDEFLANHDVRENSRKKHRDNLHFYIGWTTRNADVVNPKRSDILRYKQYLIDSGKSPSTIDNYLVSVRQFYKYLEDSGIYENIAAGVHSPTKYTGYRKAPLQPDQVATLLAAVKKSSLVGLRDYAIINLMVRTGMRCCEVARTNVKNLRIENKIWVIYIQGKGHYEADRALGLTEKVVGPISEYIRENNLQESSPLFLNHAHASNGTRITTLTISKIVKRYLRSIGIDSGKITAHSLRHTAAISALKAGATILDVQSMLGHRSVETTMIYQRSIEEERQREGTAVRFLDNAYEICKMNDKSSDSEIRERIPG